MVAELIFRKVLQQLPLLSVYRCDKLIYVFIPIVGRSKKLCIGCEIRFYGPNDIYYDYEH